MDKPRLLVVEDEDAIRKQMKWALAADYEVTLAENRATALERARLEKPPLVLLDLGLPPFPRTAEEGLRCLKELLRIDPGTKVAAEFGTIPALAIDPVQMKKVVTNLLLNAAEATGAKGAIRLFTSEADGWVVLTVSDDGVGMSPEFIARSLFKPFSTTKSGGFGIGLYQVKGIVEAHGGRIEVESGVGRGSSFRVLLPKEKA